MMASEGKEAAVAVGLSIALAELMRAAGKAITALSFETERAFNAEDMIAAKQSADAKAALIAGLETAKRAVAAGNEILS